MVEVPKVLKAIKVAERAHKGQKRKVSGAPYFHHPIAVAFILLSFKRSAKLTDLVVACILHDTLEDTDLTFDYIAKEFGEFVASLVAELTNDEEEIKKIGKKEYHKKKFLHMSSYALLAKLADRLQSFTEHPTEQMKSDTRYIITHMLQNRSTLTKAHRDLAGEILKLC